MPEGLIGKQEKPSNTEVLGLLLDPDKKKFITKLNRNNIKGLCRLLYKVLRLKNPEVRAIKIHQYVISEYFILMCSLDGTRAGQIVDALKHIIEDQNKDDMQSLLDGIKK